MCANDLIKPLPFTPKWLCINTSNVAFNVHIITLEIQFCITYLRPFVSARAFKAASIATTQTWNGPSMNSILRRLVFALAVVILLAGASAAQADTLLNYQITGPGSAGTFNADFTIFMHPAPSGGNSLAFWFTNLPVNVNGTLSNLTIAFSSLLGGSAAGSGTFALVGSQLFSWPSGSATPIMNTGVFSAYGISASGMGTYTVTVSPAIISAPEAASLLLLIVGLLALFGARRLRLLAPRAA